MYCIEESTCDIVRPFRRPSQSFSAPRSDSAPGELCPALPPSLRPWLQGQCLARNWLLSCWFELLPPNFQWYRLVIMKYNSDHLPTEKYLITSRLRCFYYARSTYRYIRIQFAAITSVYKMTCFGAQNYSVLFRRKLLQGLCPPKP